MVRLAAPRFQSTFPRGERPSISVFVRISFNFNPRSLVGNDGKPKVSGIINSKFQSTFPRGERPLWLLGGDLRCDFNPRSLVGNDQQQIHLLHRLLISIHVPSWGTTGRCYFISKSSEVNFNPRSLVGNDYL